jgi:5-methyltetrahydrofolate--homocysteine methyltransferase
MDLNEVYEAVLNGDREGAAAAVGAATEAGASAVEILNKGLLPAMAEVGRRFEAQEYFVPEMLVSARAMQTGLTLLRPALAKAGAKPLGKVILGTVQGDLHDIGKNLVAMMLEGAGFEVLDLGVDVPAQRFVAAARDGGDVLALSALLTTTMPQMKVVIGALEEAGLRSKLKLIVGGAPVTQGYADSIGADGYAPDASSAARMTGRLLSRS